MESRTQSREYKIHNSNKELKNELDTFIRNYKKHSGKDNITYKEIIKQIKKI